MRLQRALVFSCIAAFGTVSCLTPPQIDAIVTGNGSDQLKPLKTPIPPDYLHRTVYVPVYPSIYLGIGDGEVRTALAATVSIRNISAEHAMIVTRARYYDSTGKELREYLTGPSELNRMATAEYVVKKASDFGGPGANFLIDWWGPPDMDDPIIEAVMVGQSGTASYSFTSVGRTLKRSVP